MILETVMRLHMITHARTGPVFEDRPGRGGEIGTWGLEQSSAVALCREQPSECFLDEIGNLLRGHAAAEDAGDMGSLRNIQGLDPRIVPEGHPIVGRQRISRRDGAPIQTFFLEIHSQSPTGRTEAAIKAGR